MRRRTNLGWNIIQKLTNIAQAHLDIYVLFHQRNELKQMSLKNMFPTNIHVLMLSSFL